MSGALFKLDRNAMDAIDELKSLFGVRSGGEVIERALLLAQLAAENVDNDKRLRIERPDGSKKSFLLNK